MNREIEGSYLPEQKKKQGRVTRGFKKAGAVAGVSLALVIGADRGIAVGPSQGVITPVWEVASSGHLDDVLLGKEPVSELFNSHAEIEGLAGQEEELKRSNSIMLAFGGNTIREIKSVIRPILPTLKKFGPVGSLKYASNGFDVPGIVDQVEAIHKVYPNIKDIYAYGQSSGTHVIAQFDAELDQRKTSNQSLSDIQIKGIIIDHTPPDLSHVDGGEGYNSIINVLRAMGGDAYATMYVNMQTYHNPFKEGKSPPGLTLAQGTIVQKGMPLMEYLANKMKKTPGARMAFLTPEHPEDDDITNAALSRITFTNLFPNLDIVPVGQVEGESQNLHASPDYHYTSYNKALNEIVAKWGIPNAAPIKRVDPDVS